MKVKYSGAEVHDPELMHLKLVGSGWRGSLWDF